MLRISVAKSDGSVTGGDDLQAAISYYQDTQKGALDYYAGGMQSRVADGIHTHGGECAERPTVVIGDARALAALGLRAGQTVERDQVAALALGIHPVGSTRLLRAGPRTAWHDFTFSTPKSYGVLFASLRSQGREGEAQALLEAMAAASAKAMQHYSAHYPTARARHDDIQLPQLGETVCLLDTHSASRPVDGVADPSLHVHARLLNLSLRGDGSWSSRYYREMHNAARYLNGVFEAELRRSVETMGWATMETHHGDKKEWMSWEVEEVPVEAREAFSKRAAILEELVRREEETKGRPLTQKEKAAVSRRSRNAKAPRTRDDQTAQWAETLSEVGYLASRPTPAEVTPKERAISQLVSDGPTLLLGNRSLWAHEDTLAYVSDQAVKLCLTEAQVSQLAEEIEAHAISLRHPDGFSRFTTQARLDQEKAVAHYLLDLSSDARIAVSRETTDRAIADFETSTGKVLDPEQRDAVFALAGCQGLVMLQGWAGAGKTTSLQPLCRALEAEGYQVIGLSTSSRATAQLAADAGVESWNTRDFLTRVQHNTLRQVNGQPVPLGPRSLLIVDEAVMTNVQDLSELVAVAKTYKVAGIRLVGDTAQLHPVGGSGSIVDWLSRHLELAEVTRNYRSAVESETAAAIMLREGRGSDFLRAKDSHGLLQVFPTVEAMHCAQVEDWIQSIPAPEAATENILMSDLREAGVDQLNLLARQEWLARGWIDTSRQLQTGGRAYAVGDRVELTSIHRERVPLADDQGNILYRRGRARRGENGKVSRDARGRVIYDQGAERYRTVVTPNRTRGTVSEIDHSGLVVTTDDRDRLPSRSLHLSTKHAEKELDYGWAGTVHVTQGATVDENFWGVAPSRLVGRQSAYPADTRTRKATHVYVVANEGEERQQTIDRVGRLTSRDLTQMTTLDFLTEEDRQHLAGRLREQQEAGRQAWSADKPATRVQLELLHSLGVPADNSWSWLRASCDIDLTRQGIPGLLAESWLTDHGVAPDVARERVTHELKTAGLDTVATMHSANDSQRKLAERQVDQWLASQRSQHREPSLDEIADRRSNALAAIVLRAERETARNATPASAQESEESRRHETSTQQTRPQLVRVR
jgi:conjugative relaxase-like TrwC/TraI family protein